MTDKELIIMAMKAREMAYTPYSHHKVGAALLLEDGEVVLGCNIENAGYSATNCAERTAFFKAVSEGKYKFKKIAVVGGLEDKESLDICAPCGVCRQVMMEFCDPKTFEIVLAKVDNALNVEKITANDIEPIVTTLEEILPYGFGPVNLLLEK